MNYKFVLMKNIHLAGVHQPQIYNKHIYIACVERCIAICFEREYRIHQEDREERKKSISFIGISLSTQF